MFTIKLMKKCGITHVHEASSYTVNSVEASVSFNDITVYIGEHQANYQKIFIENSSGKTIEHFRWNGSGPEGF